MSEMEKTTENAQEKAQDNVRETVQENANGTVKKSVTDENAGKGKKDKKEKVKRSLGMEILSWVLTLLVAVAAALVIRSVIFEPVRVDGHSMDDTLADREVMFVSKFDYSSTWFCFPWQSNEAKENAPRLTLFGNPKQFDVVICRYPGRGDTNFVKRVVGMPGDTVELREGYLYVNGDKYDEPYINDEYRTGPLNTLGGFRVPAKGDSFLYSDNSLWVNGEQWAYKGTSLTGTNEKGDKLEYDYDYENNKTVLKINGKNITSEAELQSIEGIEYKLDRDYYFVMGDHRNNSNDSRSIGPIDRSMIIGHVRQVVFPFSQWRGVPNGLDVK